MRKTLEEKRAARALRNASCRHERQIVEQANGQRVQRCLSCKARVGKPLGQWVANKAPLSPESVKRLHAAGYPA